MAHDAWRLSRVRDATGIALDHEYLFLAVRATSLLHWRELVKKLLDSSSSEEPAN